MTRKDLKANEYGDYYERYIKKVDGELSLRKAYDLRSHTVMNFFDNISEELMTHRYAEDKWSINEVYQHIMDTERIFAIRMFRIGRGDKTPLSGFDQNEYIYPSGAHKKSKKTLSKEYAICRENTMNILSNLTDDNLQEIGTASGNPLSPRAAAFIILGHEVWHMEIIKERYL